MEFLAHGAEEDRKTIRENVENRWAFDDNYVPFEGTRIYWGNALCLYQAGQHDAAKALLEKAITVIDRCFQNEEPDFYIADYYIAIAKAAIQMKFGDTADIAEAKARKIVDSLDKEDYSENERERFFADYEMLFRDNTEEVRQKLRKASECADPGQLRDILRIQLGRNLLDDTTQTIERLKNIVENPEKEGWLDVYEDAINALLERKMYWEALQMVIEKKLPFLSMDNVIQAMYWNEWEDMPLTASRFTGGQYDSLDEEQLAELDSDWPQQSEHGNKAKEEADCASRRGEWEQNEPFWEPRFLPVFLGQISQITDADDVESLSDGLTRILATKGDIDTIITVLDAYEKRIKQIRKIVEAELRKKHPYIYASEEAREQFYKSQSLDNIQLDFDDILNTLVKWDHLDGAIRFWEKYKGRDDLDLYRIGYGINDYDVDIIVNALIEKKRFDEAWEQTARYVDKERRDIAVLHYCTAIAVDGQIDKALQVINTFDTAKKRSWAMFEISDQFRINKKMDEMNAMKKLALDALDAIENPETRKNQRWVYENTLDAAKQRSIGYTCLPGPIYGPYPHDPFRKQWSKE